MMFEHGRGLCLLVRKERNFMKKEYEKIILSQLKKNGGSARTFTEIYKPLKKLMSKKDLDKRLESLIKKGKVVNTGAGYAVVSDKSLIPCTVSRLKKTFGFVRSDIDDSEYFVAGKYLNGAMPGDKVLVQTYIGRNDLTEGKVALITEEKFARFTGNIVNEFGELKIVPDTLSKYAMEIEDCDLFSIKEGDKVLAEISFRGESHKDHRCRIITCFGTSHKASVCAMSVLELNGLTPMFSPEVIAEAKSVSDERSVSADAAKRLDLRDLPISLSTVLRQRILTTQFRLKERKAVTDLVFILRTFRIM